MTDLVEMFRHWNAGRSQVQIYQALNIDRKTIRKYLAPALAEGLQPAPDGEFDDELWRARIRRWFPELVNPAARAVTWPQIAVQGTRFGGGRASGTARPGASRSGTRNGGRAAQTVPRCARGCPSHPHRESTECALKAWPSAVRGRHR